MVNLIQGKCVDGGIGWLHTVMLYVHEKKRIFKVQKVQHSTFLEFFFLEFHLITTRIGH